MVTKKIIIVWSCILLLAGCKTKNHLYFYDNSEIEMELEKISDCKGLAKFVTENNLYNSKEHLYIRNIGYVRGIILKDYRDCIKNLTVEQQQKLFGPPNTYYPNGNPAYFDNIILDSKDDVISYYAGFKVFDGKSYSRKDLIQTDRNFKKAKEFTSSNKYEVTGGFEFNRIHITGDTINDCIRRKKRLVEQVFKHKHNNFIFLNHNSIIILSKVQHWQLDLNCTETFTLNEINTLFGEANLKIDNNLYFPTMDITKLRKNSLAFDGKVTCVVFQKTGYKNYYSISTERIEVENFKK